VFGKQCDPLDPDTDGDGVRDGHDVDWLVVTSTRAL
jgi:hypothetical protein